MLRVKLFIGFYVNKLLTLYHLNINTEDKQGFENCMHHMDRIRNDWISRPSTGFL